MSPVWVNGKFLDESANKKVRKWKPQEPQEKKLYGKCPCGQDIFQYDPVGMRGDHLEVVCYSCWLGGLLPESHLDCAGLQLPGIVLSN